MKRRFLKLNMRGYRRGAASFYIVAFSTLIMVIVAASFATVIISEVTRSSNDDLSQSAYDSALAGVEDAKLAYSNYRRCVASGASEDYPYDDHSNEVTCGNIIWWMNNPDLAGCDMVGLMVGRIAKLDWVNGNGGEVAISEIATSNSNSITDMNQAYTCVTINTDLDDYRATLTSDNNVRVVKVAFDRATAQEIKAIRLSWYTISETANSRRGEVLNYSDFNGSQVTFRPVGETQPATPPTMELQLIQTANNFTLGQLNGASSGTMQTDRATMFFVPTKSESAASVNNNGNVTGRDLTSTANAYIGTYNGGKNSVGATQVVKTNDQSISNLPFVTYCGDTSRDFACSVNVSLPEAVGGGRNDDTFMFLVTLPYASPDTDFSMTFICEAGNSNCERRTVDGEDAWVARIKGTQVLIDSTGRANDLYRRVETRLETTDTSFPYTYYALQLLGNPDDDALVKNMTVTCENNFYDSGTNVTFYGGNSYGGSFRGLSGRKPGC